MQTEQVRAALASATRIAVLTGAGISAESGIPTFRDAATGLWARYDPLQLASADGFRRDPALVWRWYSERRARVQLAQPNDGHRALAEAAARFERFDLITQNVDGLHRRAGSVPIELHGNIMRTICFAQCGYAEEDPARLQAGEPPRCPSCDSWLRPAVVWFGESLPPASLMQAEERAATCDLMLVVGTSGLVYPAAGLPGIARAGGAKVVIVNTQPSELDHLAHWTLRGPAAQVLPAILATR